MTVLSAQTIRRLCHPKGFLEPKLISPFVERSVSPMGKSYGLSSCGYDIRIDQDVCLYPGDYILASSMEEFDLPGHIVGTVNDKSTWARRGVTVQNTVMEPGWAGYLTLEIAYHGRPEPWWWGIRTAFSPKEWPWQPIDIPRGTPIAQIVFEFLDEPTEQPYSGKYQNQERGPQPARFEDTVLLIEQQMELQELEICPQCDEQVYIRGKGCTTCDGISE